MLSDCVAVEISRSGMARPLLFTLRVVTTFASESAVLSIISTLKELCAPMGLMTLVEYPM